MKTPEECPLCSHPMDEHVYRDEDERLWLLYYCPVCECDWAAVGMDEFLAITGDPLGTRPIATITCEVNHERR